MCNGSFTYDGRDNVWSHDATFLVLNGYGGTEAERDRETQAESRRCRNRECTVRVVKVLQLQQVEETQSTSIISANYVTKLHGTTLRRSNSTKLIPLIHQQVICHESTVILITRHQYTFHHHHQVTALIKWYLILSLCHQEIPYHRHHKEAHYHNH